MAAQDLTDELRAAMPTGIEDLLDWQDPDGPGPLFAALGQVLFTCGEAQVADLRQQLSPLTCSADTLAIWEASLNLEQSRWARTGTVDQRRAQVLARLRELGPSTLRLVRTVVYAYLGYADLSLLKIIEPDRDALRVAHTRVWTGSAPVGPAQSPVSLTWQVLDDPAVSLGGAQLDLTFDAPVYAAGMDISLTNPGLTTIQKQGASIGRGAGFTWRLYFPQFRGTAIFGNWTASVVCTELPVANLVRADLFVEGWGRYTDWLGRPGDGLGAAMYEWGAIAEPNLVGADPDFDAADLAVRRLNYAIRRGALLLRAQDLTESPQGEVGAIPDDPWCIPDQAIPD